MKMQSKNSIMTNKLWSKENILNSLFISFITLYEFSKIGIWSNNIDLKFSRFNYTFLNFSSTTIFIFYTFSLFFILKYLKSNIKELSSSYLKLFVVIFFKKLLVSSTIFFTFQISFVSRLELILFSAIYSILFTVLFLIKDIRKLALIILVMILSIYTVFINSGFYTNSQTVNCMNSFSFEGDNLSEGNKSIFVIGHAYGSQSTNLNGLSNKVQNLFNDIEEEQILVLTGDIVLNNSIKSLEEVKNQIESSFKEYLIAVGNHDIGDLKQNKDKLQTNDNFIEIFEKDLYIEEFENFSLIAANFSTPDWEPGKVAKNNINNHIKNTENEIIFLFSHQIFWAKEVSKPITPNGMNLLENDLKEDSLHWLDYEDKKIIIISGDYGVTGNKTFCEKVDNKLFIANGIGDLPQDTYIKISYNNNFLRLDIIDLAS